MKPNEFHRGYLRNNNFSEYLSYDNKWKRFVYAEHMYASLKPIECYDKDGNFIDNIIKHEYYNRLETIEIKEDFRVVQINYEFHIIPIGRCVTQQEVMSVCTLLNNSNLGKFDYDYSKHEYFYYAYNSPDIGKQYFHKKMNESLDMVYYYFKKPKEISVTGASYWITRKSYNSFLNLNINDYIKNKNKFIKKNPEYKDEVEMLFNLNINSISAYYMIEPKNIKRKYNKIDRMIKRLNYNINLKIK